MNDSTPTLADFAAWLAASQQIALDGMGSTTGEAFALHASDFALLSAANTVLIHFNGVGLGIAPSFARATNGRA